jgi:ribosomal-protein-serine acetyltransferase
VTARPILPAAVPASRLVLREYDDGDAPTLAAAVAASLDHLRPWMAWVASEPLPPATRLDMLRTNRRSRLAGGDGVYGAWAGDTLVGGCGLHHRRGPGTLEIGCWVHAAHLRRGYATEMSAALTTAALAVEGIDRVEIHHDRANRASRGVPATLGYDLESEHPDEPEAPAEEGIDCTWVMTRARWPVLRGGDGFGT